MIGLIESIDSITIHKLNSKDFINNFNGFSFCDKLFKDINKIYTFPKIKKCTYSTFQFLNEFSLKNVWIWDSISNFVRNNKLIEPDDCNVSLPGEL